jgi:phage shock protein E
MGWFSRLLQADPPAPLPAQAMLIDVRSPAEYQTGAVEGSINLPLDRFAQEIERLVPERDTPLLVFCAAGGRSAPTCSGSATRRCRTAAARAWWPLACSARCARVERRGLRPVAHAGKALPPPPMA